MLDVLLVFVDRTIKLDYKLGLCTVKIYDVRYNDSLFVDFNGIIFEKSIPKLVLLRRHFAAKRPRGFQHLVIFREPVFLLHKYPSPSAAQPLSHRERHWRVG